jgi:hypothetical protein
MGVRRRRAVDIEGEEAELDGSWGCSITGDDMARA